MPISSSLTILTTCWAGLSAPETSAPLARSLMRATNSRTTGSETSASSSASRISRVVASMSASVSRPLPRSPCRAPVNRSDSDSNTPSSLTGLGNRLRRRGRGQHGVEVVLQLVADRACRLRGSAELPSPTAVMPNTSTTDEPSVVTFAHAMSTPSRSNTAVSLASRPVRSVVRICTTSSPGSAPLGPQDPRRGRCVVDRHRVRHFAGSGGAVLRGLAVALVQRRRSRPVHRRGRG